MLELEALAKGGTHSSARLVTQVDEGGGTLF